MGWLERLGDYLQLLPSGIGEIGLDRGCRTPPAEQMAVFRAQIAVARQRQLPVTIHCVRAWGKLRQALADDGPHEPGIILHGYGGPAEVVEVFLSLGGYFSFSFAVLGEGKDVAALRLVPEDRLLLESDAPYRCPPPELGGAGGLTLQGINEPANLESLYTRVAAIRGVTPATLAQTVAANGRRILTKLGIPAA